MAILWFLKSVVHRSNTVHYGSNIEIAAVGGEHSSSFKNSTLELVLFDAFDAVMQLVARL